MSLYILGFVLACFCGKIALWASTALLQGLSPSASLLFQPTARGVELFEGSIIAAGKSVPAMLVRVSRKRRIEVGTPEKGQDGDSLSGYQDRYGAYVVLSGGFLKSFFPPIPLGFVKHSGIVVNRAANGFTGLFVARPGQVSIVRYRDDGCSSTWDDCLQSGPLLVYGGDTALPKPGMPISDTTRDLIERETIRAFAAVQPDGNLVLGWTEPVSLPALVEFLMRPQDRGGLGCAAAINLSGSTSAGLLVNTGKSTIRMGSTDIFLPNAIVVH